MRFLGYDPANIKLVAFVVAAIMASVGGAMFVPIAGMKAVPRAIGQWDPLSALVAAVRQVCQGAACGTSTALGDVSVQPEAVGKRFCRGF